MWINYSQKKPMQQYHEEQSAQLTRIQNRKHDSDFDLSNVTVTLKTGQSLKIVRIKLNRGYRHAMFESSRSDINGENSDVTDFSTCGC